MPDLSKQAVLSGPVDFCCLVCETTFQNLEEVVQHVETQQHIDNFTGSSYVEKYAAEHIRKVKQYLYCEACNIVIPSSRKIQNHVSEDTHEFNNTTEESLETCNTFTRCNEKVIAFNDILIEENAWNGIIEESCIVCDVDWEDLKAHLCGVKHVINLIQAKVHSGFGNTLFRKIDNTQFHCLSCNAILPQDQFISHWDSTDHKKLHIQCRKAKRALQESKVKVKEDKVKSENDQSTENNEQEIENKQIFYKKEKEHTKETDEVNKPKKINEETESINKITEEQRTETINEKIENLNRIGDNIKPNNESGENGKTKLSNEKPDKRVEEDMEGTKKEYDETENTNIEDFNKIDEPVEKNYSEEILSNDIISSLPDLENSIANDEKCTNFININQETISIPEIEIHKIEPTQVHKSATHPTSENSGENKANDKPKSAISTDSALQSKIIIKKKVSKQEELLYNDLNKELDIKSYMLVSDDEFIMCALCNWEYERNHYKSHLNSEHHKILEKLNKSDIQDINNKIFSKMYKTSVDICKEDEENLLSYLMNESKFAKTNMDLNFYEIWCRKCENKLTPKRSYVQIHIEECYNNVSASSKNKIEEENIEKKDLENSGNDEAKDKTEVASQKINPEEELIKFYKENNISFNGRYATCRACNIEMGHVKKCIKEHINGARHKRNSENYVCSEEESDCADSSEDTDSEEYRKAPMEEYVIHWKAVGEDCLINNRIWVSLQSYCLTENGECFCCEVEFGGNIDDFERHVNSDNHKKNMAQIPVLTSLDNEFVRELKSNKYHCGFCPMLLNSGRELQRHLRHSSDHHLNRKMLSTMYTIRNRDELLSQEMLHLVSRINRDARRSYFN